MNGKPDTWLILTPGFPKDESDSTCLPLQQALVKTLQQMVQPVQLIVISFQYPFEQKEYRWQGIPVFAIGGKNRGGLYRRLTWQRVNRQLSTLQNTTNIRGIFSFWCGETALIASRFAKAAGIRHYCWICGQDARAMNKLVKKIKPRADELVALSDFIANEFEKNHAIRPAHTIPPGIDESLFMANEGSRVIDLLAAGSLLPLKQFDRLIALVAALKDQFPGLRTAIAGDGPERKKLETLIRSQRLENNIQLTGELPHAELLRLMQRTRIFIHPSAYEGFGVVQIEALYAGAQVVSFVQPMKKEIPNWHIVSGMEEMKTKTTGLLQQKENQSGGLFDFSINRCAESFVRLFNEAN